MDKHHQEISALASLLGAFRFPENSGSFVTGTYEYTFDRERAVALLALGVSTAEGLEQSLDRYRGKGSAYLDRMAALAQLARGDGTALKSLHRSLVRYQDYEPFGTPLSLRRDIYRRLLPPAFRHFLDLCGTS
ncbi:MAG: hypothetical protein U5N86_03905 [Planctomycetota bacterium]|nr:hypothetical protein [Planctomycetota bacterium]